MITVDASDPAKPNVSRMISTALRPVFPFLVLNFVPKGEGEESITSVDIKSDDKVIEYMSNVYGGNKILLYLDPDNGKVEAWSSSMLFTLDYMSENELMSSIEEWTNKAKSKLLLALDKKVKSMGE